jgi:hypothetical protein
MYQSVEEQAEDREMKESNKESEGRSSYLVLEGSGSVLVIPLMPLHL